MESGSSDIVIKLANTCTGRSSTQSSIVQDDLVLWTGEKVGLLSFSRKEGFTSETFEDVGEKSEGDLSREREERGYEEMMRRALVANADEVRYLSGLGLQFGYGGP